MPTSRRRGSPRSCSARSSSSTSSRRRGGWVCRTGAAWGEGPKDFLRKPVRRRVRSLRQLLRRQAGAALLRGASDGARGGRLLRPVRVPHPVPQRWAVRAAGRLRLGRRRRSGWRTATFGAVLDTFDTYNFTVREDEPLEKEVAVDPEMLGKVFENLLEVKDRKAKGAFYTPREIVAYMCNESLIAYLDGRLNGDGSGGRRTERAALAREETPQNDMFTGTPAVQGTLAAEADAPARAARGAGGARARGRAVGRERPPRDRERRAGDGARTNGPRPRPSASTPPTSMRRWPT